MFSYPTISIIIHKSDSLSRNWPKFFQFSENIIFFHIADRIELVEIKIGSCIKTKLRNIDKLAEATKISFGQACFNQLKKKELKN